MRIALKVAYDGTRFAGSQVQPDVRTVHGELAKALRELGAREPRILWAGRTDAGVSAAGNVAVVDDPPVAPASLAPALTFRMEDAWAWAWAEVPDAFEPRHARRRRYRYHLRTALDAKLVEDALRPFVGTHDFTGFARLEPDVNPVRTVFAAHARRDGPFVLVDIEGESFLWNQVRRMVEAARRVAAGELPRARIEQALAAPQGADLGTAAPEPLLLLDVEYAGLRFHDERRRVVERLERRVEDAELRLTMLRSLGGA
ncbi:MAG TPA: tRNA pseudouridine(38-40) synthase TruA [Candidatus Thermoplasmatota archaeon]|nr:tRNA pseudouridine(38-40) synthase TruA [Candidatus Thermoplasmatota archaeon]